MFNHFLCLKVPGQDLWSRVPGPARVAGVAADLVRLGKGASTVMRGLAGVAERGTVAGRGADLLFALKGSIGFVGRLLYRSSAGTILKIGVGGLVEC